MHPRSQQRPDLGPAARLPVDLHVLAVGAEEASAGGAQRVLGLRAEALRDADDALQADGLQLARPVERKLGRARVRESGHDGTGLRVPTDELDRRGEGLRHLSAGMEWRRIVCAHVLGA